MGRLVVVVFLNRIESGHVRVREVRLGEGVVCSCDIDGVGCGWLLVEMRELAVLKLPLGGVTVLLAR